MGIRLTERDIYVLKKIHKNSVLDNKRIRMLYGNTAEYHFKRLKKMVQEGLVIRDWGYVRITQKGMAAIGAEGKPLKLRKSDMKKRVEMLNLADMLPDWEFKSSFTIKEEKNLNRGSYISTYIKKGKIGYAVYYVNSQNPHRITLNRILHELGELRLKRINRALVLCKHEPVINIIFKKIINPGSDELLLLPYPEGLIYFKLFHSDSLSILLNKKLPGLKPGNRKFADYKWRDKYVSVLIANDGVRRYFLDRYYEMVYQREKKDVIIVCTHDQRRFFAKLYPHAKIVYLHRVELEKSKVEKKKTMAGNGSMSLHNIKNKVVVLD